MPLIHIEIMEGRKEEKIEELIVEVTQTVEKVLDAPKENIRVIIQEVPKTHWGIGGVSAKKSGR
ncbi:4-oxalocrotonate tautomerase [Listeria floridensis FSL S10-1187]|uniref:Tautomerase n=1 Tax=Listeria floridensis FSL S10-1187 TaxID=1265817 RepID=A0ABN0RC65_9LIST|nr:4-oxalocrotonate tautomerase [Listeria floridensis]EUJ26752.1 4-oxalocrotonate tautomerase [Listeria floridensis FSL S10-1187]